MSTLCLACSSSLPPVRQGSSKIFVTPCCSLPICPSCISSNHRLARYDPCLSCLGGVDVIRATTRRNLDSSSQPKNLDGSIRDQDMFVLGDDDEEEEGACNDEDERAQSEPPPYSDSPGRSEPSADVDHGYNNDQEKASDPVYYIKKSDTLQGIALRFNVSGRLLCQLNSLPPSTLTTTPHLLHTRCSLVLPRTCASSLTQSHKTTAKDPERDQLRKIERAERKLQTLTKESDWRIAKAYVAISDPNDLDYLVKQKEAGQTSKWTDEQLSLERAAAERYFEDEEWEAAERRAGRNVSIPSFPFAGRQKVKG